MEKYEELEIRRSKCVKNLQLHEFALKSLKQEERRIAGLKEDAEWEVRKLNQEITQVDKEIREMLLPLYPEGFQRSE